MVPTNEVLEVTVLVPSPVVETVAVKPPPTAPVRGAGMLEMDGVLAAPLYMTALPSLSTAIQKVLLTHDTAVRPAPGDWARLPSGHS